MHISDLSRPEVIDALRPHVQTKYFHSLFTCSTPFLKAVLTFYEEGGQEAELDAYFTVDEMPQWFIGFDPATEGGDHTAMFFRSLLGDVTGEEKVYSHTFKREDDCVIATAIHDFKKGQLVELFTNDDGTFARCPHYGSAGSNGEGGRDGAVKKIEETGGAGGWLPEHIENEGLGPNWWVALLPYIGIVALFALFVWSLNLHG